MANQIAEPLPVRSKDEFGQVTEAFNAVHLEAVRTAAEQAALRSSVATMFVNLARRSQILVDRLIGHLDRLERGEEDPDRLAELFQLDHLATRMRRNDENLLVLAGADSTRVQREPAALIDVLRAAQSEVEHYTRIEFGVVDRDIEVAAHAVNDLVHLVAELFDNATAFSPPDSQVMVEARRIGDRASLYVEDRGIGITPDQLRELNERLATPPQVDVAVSRMMGLVVVARLASRHGVKVELRPGLGPGHRRRRDAAALGPGTARPVRADASMPGAFPAIGQQPESPAPSFGAPLALEGSFPRRGPRERDGGYGANGHPAMPTTAAPTLAVTPGQDIPAWSDLTGAGNGSRSGSVHAPAIRRTGGGATTPAAGHRFGRRRRRADRPRAGSDVPRQIPTSGDRPAAPKLPPPVRAPVASAPPVAPRRRSRRTAAFPVVTAPPETPPAARLAAGTGPSRPNPGAADATPPRGRPSAPRTGRAAPQAPERLAAALDMTAELPRMGPRAERGGARADPRPVPAQRRYRRPSVGDRRQKIRRRDDGTAHLP